MNVLMMPGLSAAGHCLWSIPEILFHNPVNFVQSRDRNCVVSTLVNSFDEGIFRF